MTDLDKSRDELLGELKTAYEKGASIRSLVATTACCVSPGRRCAAAAAPTISGAEHYFWRTDASTRSSTALRRSVFSPDASRATSPSRTRSR